MQLKRMQLNEKELELQSNLRTAITNYLNEKAEEKTYEPWESMRIKEFHSLQISIERIINLSETFRGEYEEVLLENLMVRILDLDGFQHACILKCNTELSLDCEDKQIRVDSIKSCSWREENNKFLGSF